MKKIYMTLVGMVCLLVMAGCAGVSGGGINQNGGIGSTPGGNGEH